LILILFLEYRIEPAEYLFDFVKKNFLLLIGLACIMLLYLMPPIHYLIRKFPFLMNIPIAILFLKYTYIYIVLTIDLYLLNKKKNQNL